MTNKSILVLEENSVVHGLIASALDIDGLTLHHEFNPAKYVDRARSVMPDLILVSNADQFNNYSITRQLKTGSGSGTPVVLLANSKDKLDDSRLRDLHVDGVVRKPFEASDLQAQVSRHLHMPDLVGAAYEFRQSQGSRETMFDPLAQMDVLDDETVTMMKATGKPGAMPVPEVDFSAELRREATSETTTTRIETTTRTETRSARMEMHSNSTMEGTQSPLPLAEFDDSDLTPLDAAESDTLLESSTFEQEDLSAPFPAMRAGDEADFEELGVEDLLSEESIDEGMQLTMDEEITETRIEATPVLRPSTLDKIDVELSASDLMMQQAAGLEPEPDDMTLFEQDRDGAGSPPVDETIPLAVRRMMELKPVFTAPARTMGEREETRSSVETVQTRTTTQTVRTETTAVPEMPWPKVAADDAPVGDPLDDLHDIDLGEDALDEEQILSAMESGPLMELDDLDNLDDDSLLSLSMEEDDQLSSLAEPTEAELELSAPEEDDEEISIDEDEEELILSSLEEEEMGEMALGSTRVNTLDLTSTERTGLDEIMAMHGEPEPEPLPLPPMEPEAEFEDMDLGLPAQEATPREAALPFPSEEVLEVPLEDDFLLEPEPMQTVMTTVTEVKTVETATVQQTTRTAVSPFPPEPEVAIEFGADDLEADLFSGTDLGTLGDDLTESVTESEPFPELDPEPMTGLDTSATIDFEEETDLFAAETLSDPKPQAMDMSEPEPQAAAADDDGTDLDFEDAFASLRDEIQSNPEGEHLDDVLRLEGIQNKISRLDFTIPQHESPFARGMGIYATAEGTMAMSPQAAATAAQATSTARATAVRAEQSSRSASTTVTTEQTLHTTTIETRLTQALDGSALTGSLLDEATKARLSQVLDEIISISVRKAVREEMPRLMQRLAKDSPQA